MKLSLKAQIAEVEREIAMRKRVYPQQVRNRAMREAEAQYHLAAMERVLDSLKFLQKHEAAIREHVANQPAKGPQS